LAIGDQAFCAVILLPHIATGIASYVIPKNQYFVSVYSIKLTSVYKMSFANAQDQWPLINYIANRNNSIIYC